jgi:hypothetical protein
MSRWMDKQLEIAQRAKETRERAENLRKLREKNSDRPETVPSLILKLVLLGVFLIYFLPHVLHPAPRSPSRRVVVYLSRTRPDSWRR